ncbi:MAG: hypothetical protein Q8P02_04270, partial [Candidatus Micrarchaeota archaeon]|nr:hypothetical protein [Candidatus Micrarchaeota archaeon]
MTFADDIADLWKKVPKEVADAEKPAHVARILRLTLQSKKIIAESGRPTAVLPMVRELVRRQYLRIPSEHVPFLEVTVFDLLANPIKKKLQESVSQFTPDDASLVRWFVSH